MFFGPTSACKEYLQSRVDFIDYAIADSSPADYIIEVALTLRDHKEHCKQSIADLAVHAKEYAMEQYPKDLSGPITSEEKRQVLMRSDGSLYKEEEKKSLFAAVSEMVVDNFKADIEDIKKSPVTIYILLKREFLKEIRRYWFWVVTFFRAIALGVVIGKMRCKIVVSLSYLYIFK